MTALQPLSVRPMYGTCKHTHTCTLSFFPAICACVDTVEHRNIFGRCLNLVCRSLYLYCQICLVGVIIVSSIIFQSRKFYVLMLQKILKRVTDWAETSLCPDVVFALSYTLLYIQLSLPSPRAVKRPHIHKHTHTV